MKKRRSIVKSTFKTFIDVPSWLGWNQIKENSSSIWGAILPVLRVRKTNRKETFEQAMSRFNLTEADLVVRARRCIREIVFYFILACIGFIYMVYLFVNAHILAGLIMILVGMLLIIKALGSHFWYFQIKHRKLGCTLKEWINGSIFGLDKYFKDVWILVSNVVYFVFAFVLIWIAFMNII